MKLAVDFLNYDNIMQYVSINSDVHQHLTCDLGISDSARRMNALDYMNVEATVLNLTVRG